MVPHCPGCGADILRAKARFCDNCGLKLAVRLGDRPGSSALESRTIAYGETTRPPPEATGDDGATTTLPESEVADQTHSPRPSARARVAHAAPRLETEVTEDGEATVASPKLKTHRAISAKDPELEAGTVLARRQRFNSDLKIGYVLHRRYQITKVLGAGGFGAVYRAEDIKLKRPCVIKQMLTRGKSPKKLEIYRTNFEREARLLVQLNHPGHPNIPEIYDHFFEAEGNYLVMKYIEGHSLKELLDQPEASLPGQDVLRYGVDLCSALHYMHTYGPEPVMHRDIKPANIVLGDDGRIWLVDFGLAKAQPIEDKNEASVTKAGGSIGYTPLEQWLGEARPASDIYALGATLHHLLTGLNPVDAFGDEFHIQKLQQLHGQFIAIHKVNRELSPALAGIIASAAGADPEQRPTALQLQQQLNVFISGAKDTPLFTFKSGESTKTKGKFVDLCDRYQPEAEGYLYRGDFERWFSLTNRNDLAAAAVEAIKQSRNQKEGLERFLKLVLPNLFWRRLGRASLHIARGSIQFILTTLVVMILLAVAGSYIARLVIWQAIGNYDWNFEALKVNEVNNYQETYLNKITNDNTRFIFDRVLIDTRAPNQINISASWAGFALIEIPLTVQLVADQKPQVHLAKMNNIPLYLITDNISQGINDGLETALGRAPINITGLDITDIGIALKVKRKPGLLSPPPTLTPGETGQPTVTPTFSGVILLAVFNRLDQDIILEIDGGSWAIAAHEQKIIETNPGFHSYAARTVDGRLAAQGQTNWTLSAYKIEIDRLETD